MSMQVGPIRVEVSRAGNGFEAYISAFDRPVEIKGSPLGRGNSEAAALRDLAVRILRESSVALVVGEIVRR